MSSDPKDDAIDPSVTFVTNMKTAREAQEIGRKRFADLMRERGHAWHESVVPKVENQTRAIKLGEAIAIADILNLSVEQLATEVVDSRVAVLARVLSRLETAERDLENSVAEFTLAQIQFEKARDWQPDAVSKFAAKTRLEELGTRDIVAFASDVHSLWRGADSEPAS